MWKHLLLICRELLVRRLWIDHLFTICSAALTSRTRALLTCWQGFSFALIFLFFLSRLPLLHFPLRLFFVFSIECCSSIPLHQHPPFYPFTCCQFFIISSDLPLIHHRLSVLPLIIYSQSGSQLSCLCVLHVHTRAHVKVQFCCSHPSLLHISSTAAPALGQL